MILPRVQSALAAVVLLAYVACGASDNNTTGDAGTTADAGARAVPDSGADSGAGGSTDGGAPVAGGTAPTGGSAGNSTIEPSGGSAGSSTDEDRPYANVTAVSAAETSGGYTFDVSVESADKDCTQYANWWEVLGEDGTLLYRRILEHSHTDENGTSDADAPGNTFTRSGGPVQITADEVVIVRAHMSTGGYDGTVMHGSVAQGFAEAPDIDGTFAAGVESEDPQPAGCLF